MGRQYISKRTKEKIRQKGHNCCEYCQCLATHVPVSFVTEHIIPLNKNGKDTLDNYAFACHGCNSFKHTKTESIDPMKR